MRPPPENSGYPRFVNFGRYTARYLRAAGYNDLSDTVREATEKVKVLGRAWEDADAPLQDAMADRDFADHRLDRCAQETRLSLSARGLDATREEPYTKIFAEGMGYYTAAPLDREVERYTELRNRLEQNLAGDDPVRTLQAPELDKRIAAFVEASSRVSVARGAESTARVDLESAIDGWLELIEKVYGTMVAEVGKAEAERYFPRHRASSAKSAATEPAGE